jgi:heme/copper-type cytochrome/quinol oxidase subunit 4
MSQRLRAMGRATWAWAVLVLATALTYWLAEGHAIAAPLATTAALLIAGVKVRVVLLEFMDLRTAPLLWRLAFELWVVASVLLILIGYALSRP